MNAIVQKVTYNNGKLEGYKVWDATAKDLVDLFRTLRVPHSATVTPECDCYTGCEGPNRYLEILWSV